MGDLTKWFEGN